MSRRVIISGLGPVSGLGLGIGPTWEAVAAGRSAVGPFTTFDASGFDCRFGSEVRDFKVSNYVPKSYRKAVKVMARDIELAVAAADLAARDAGLITKGTAPEPAPAPGSEVKTSYPSRRMGAHIGAGLIAAELNELTAALNEARTEAGAFDIHKWGNVGINHLTPLWLLKYLPNMLACHVTIIHDTQGPSNTITCAEASGGLSIGESLRVIQRGAADLCFCGGTESKINPMAYLRQLMTGRYNTTDNDTPATAVRPFARNAAGAALGEGGGIVILESLETYAKRQALSEASGVGKTKIYAEVVGFGASQSVNLASRNLRPDAEGRAIAVAIRSAMRDAKITPDQIDLIVPFGAAVPDIDSAEAAALASVFANGLASIPITSTKAMVGNCGAGAGGLDVCIAAKAVAEQMIPAIINCDQPLAGLNAGTAASRPAKIRHALVYSVGIGGQNAALILKRFEA